MRTVNIIGLILDFVGVIMLLVYSARTQGATTSTDQGYLASPWWHRIGYGLLGLGFLLQILAACS